MLRWKTEEFQNSLPGGTPFQAVPCRHCPGGGPGPMLEPRASLPTYKDLPPGSPVPTPDCCHLSTCPLPVQPWWGWGGFLGWKVGGVSPSCQTKGGGSHPIHSNRVCPAVQSGPPRQPPRSLPDAHPSPAICLGANDQAGPRCVSDSEASSILP